MSKYSNTVDLVIFANFHYSLVALLVEELDLRKNRSVQPTILTKSDYIFC